MILPLGGSDGLYYVRVQRIAQSEILKTAQEKATINDGDVRLDIELELSNVSARDICCPIGMLASPGTPSQL